MPVPVDLMSCCKSLRNLILRSAVPGMVLAGMFVQIDQFFHNQSLSLAECCGSDYHCICHSEGREICDVFVSGMQNVQHIV